MLVVAKKRSSDFAEPDLVADVKRRGRLLSKVGTWQ